MADVRASRVTVVVLSYDRPQLLQRALESIAAQTLSDFDVVVVDNRSPQSDRIQQIVAAFPGVRLIANSWNAGFTGGMNRGLSAATGEYVYLTEDDVELDRECLGALVTYLEAHPGACLAGPVMWNLGTRTIRCAGGRFTLGPTYQMTVHASGARELAERDPFDTMYLPGAAIAARASGLRELGGFREDFFMYSEDVELCARALERGWRIAIVPGARVFHHEPPDASASALLNYHKQKNLAALYLLHAPARVLPTFLARYVVLDGLRRLVKEPGTLPMWAKAWCWAAWRSPRLLAERRMRAA